MSAHIAYTAATLCLSGGLMGFARQGSMPSLVAGVSLGLMYGTSGYLIANNKGGGVELATATSVLLCGAMIPKALRTRKPVPITMGVIGLLSLVYYGKKYYEQINGV